MPDVELKKKLLEVNNITLEAALDKVRKWEASREQANQMVTPVLEPGASTNVVEETSGRGFKGKQRKTYFNCGKDKLSPPSGNYPPDAYCLVFIDSLHLGKGVRVIDCKIIENMT